MHTEKRRRINTDLNPCSSVFIRGVYPWPSPVAFTRGLERVADAAEEGGPLPIDGRIARPRRAAGEGQAHVVRDHRVERELAAGRRAEIGGAERGVPRAANVDERRAVQRVEEQRPRAEA